MEQDIKKIDRFITIMKSDFRTGLYYKHELDALEHLIKAYKELKEEYSNEQKSELIAYKILQEKKLKLEEENKILTNKLLDTMKGSKIIKEETPQYIKENYIPVSLVEETIEEYKKKIDIAQGEELLILDSKIDVLQELLEKEK